MSGLRSEKEHLYDRTDLSELAALDFLGRGECWAECTAPTTVQRETYNSQIQRLTDY